MNFKISKEILLENLSIVSNALSTKNLIPVLEGIKFDVSKKGIFLTTNDNEISIYAFIQSENVEKIEKSGSVVIPGKYILDMIRKTEEKVIDISLIDELKINISTSKYQTNLNGMSSNDFPNILFEKTKEPIILKRKVLKEVITQTSFATSTSESNPILTGINIKLYDDTLECNATDMRRLSRKKVNINYNKENSTNVVIPSKNVNILKNILTDTGEIELHIFDNKILFVFDNVCFQSRLLNGNYPSTDKLISTSFLETIKVNTKELYKALDRIILLSNKVKLQVKDNELLITTGFVQMGNGNERIGVKQENNVEVSLCIDALYLIEALKIIDDEEITISFNSETDPIIITSKNKNLIELILPIISLDI